MSENIYDRINRTLTWKRVVTFNVVLFLVLIVPLSVKLAQQNTENRSGAAEELDIPAVTPPPSYPLEAPRLDRVSMFFGKKGDTVVILGNNFGDYQWGSTVYVGNVMAPQDAVVRWSNNVIEVRIPEAARSGQVWVNVAGREAKWEGNLLLYDSTSNAKLGLNKINANKAQLLINGTREATHGLIELGYVSEPVTLESTGGIRIDNQTLKADALGKKMLVLFTLENGLLTGSLEISHPGIGALELVRAELYNTLGELLPLYVDPLEMKILP